MKSKSAGMKISCKNGQARKFATTKCVCKMDRTWPLIFGMKHAWIMDAK